jgi:hypothetical protein
MPNHGDTFLLANAEINNHFFIIISDPSLDPDRIVMANFTSWDRLKDKTCMVLPGEHPFVTRQSCIYYGHDKLLTVAIYDLFLSRCLLTPQEPVSKGLLDRILAGAATSRDLPLGHRKILADQGLIDAE